MMLYAPHSIHRILIKCSMLNNQYHSNHCLSWNTDICHCIDDECILAVLLRQYCEHTPSTLPIENSPNFIPSYFRRWRLWINISLDTENSQTPCIGWLIPCFNVTTEWSRIGSILCSRQSVELSDVSTISWSWLRRAIQYRILLIVDMHDCSRCWPSTRRVCILYWGCSRLSKSHSRAQAADWTGTKRFP